MDLLNLHVEVHGRRIYGNRFKGWGLVDLQGWWDSPDNRSETVLNPAGWGALPYTDPMLGTVRGVIRGEAVALSPERGAQDRAWLRSLAAVPDLGLRIWEQGGWLSVRGAQVDGRVKVATGFQGHRTEFEIPFGATDPVRYGPPATPIVLDAQASATGGLAWPVVDGAFDFGQLPGVTFPGFFSVENVGTTPFHIESSVRGPMDGFQIISDGRVVECSTQIPAGSTVTVSPYLGGRAVMDGTDVSVYLTRAEFTPVCPGATQNYLFVPLNPGHGSRLQVDYPEGAWL